MTTTPTLLPYDMVDEKLCERDLTWEGLRSGAYGFGIDEFERFLVADDKVLFAAAFLKNPRTIPDSKIVAGEPLILLDYQQESIRYRGNKVTQDGSEIGKTLEIIADFIHELMTQPNKKHLIGAPEFVHLVEIIDSIEEQRSMSEAVRQSIWVHRKVPHYQYRSANGGILNLIPAGHDGTAFRGQHIDGEAAFDEAVKAKNKKILSEFFRALLPGAVVSLYSVPDGTRDTEWYRIKEQARRLGDGASLDDFKYFHRPKTLQPPPFWDEKREKKAIEQYGGRHSSGYIHNVLGLDGDPENPIFPYTLWEKLLAPIDEYRLIKLSADESSGELRIEVTRLSVTITDDKTGKINSVDPVIVADEVYPLAPFRSHPTEPGHTPILSLLSRFIPAPSPGFYIGGCDPGKINDAAEIAIHRRSGDDSAFRLRRVLRISMRQVPYDLQASIMAAMADHFSIQSMGLDLGGVGVPLLDDIKAHHKRLAQVLFAHHFEGKTQALNLAGEVIEDERKGEPITRTFREVFVTLYSLLAQQYRVEEPWDTEIINSFTSYTATQGKNGNMIFSKKDDHVVDATTQAVGAMFLSLFAPSISVGGVSLR